MKFVSEIGVRVSKLCRTWNHIASIHSILVFDEAKAIHEFDLSNLTSAMSIEVRLNVSLCRVARKVPEIEAGGRDFRHCGGYGDASARQLAWSGKVSAVLDECGPCRNQNAKAQQTGDVD
jgi:hypothetical protein